jgi:hypothetical protein
MASDSQWYVAAPLSLALMTPPRPFSSAGTCMAMKLPLTSAACGLASPKDSRA